MRIRVWTGILALVALAPPASAQTGQRCIYVLPAQLKSLSHTMCGGGPLWQPFVSTWIGCEDPSTPVANLQHCKNAPYGAEFSAWYAENKPEGTDFCAPWSAAYSECDAGPTQNTCEEPTNATSSCLGDPVDVTTGTLEQQATDVDLGRGLSFERFYASHASTVAASPLGARWRQSLDWKLSHRNLIGQGSATSPLVEAVAVKRPLRTTVVFLRHTWAAPVGSEPWRGGVKAAGGLEGSATSGFVFTDDDGTRVSFAATTFEVTAIQRPGAPMISVSTSGSTTTYTAAGASLAVTLAAGKVATVTGGGETWTYAYDAAGCLHTVTGPNPANPSESVQWIYTYSGGSAPACRLTGVQRQIDSNAPVAIAAWTWGTNGLVSSMDEPALDQTLHLTYTGTASNRTTSVRDVAGTTAPTLATFTSQNGRVVSTTGEGGPGVSLSLASATFTGATSNGAPVDRWKTKTDLNGAVTLYEDHDARGRPGRIVEGWEDAESSGSGHGVLSSPDTFLRKREYTYHPTLEGPLTITEPSVLNSAGSRVVTNDYDSDLDATPNEAPTDRLYRKIEQGWTLDEDGAQFAFTDTTEYGYDASGRLTSIEGPRAAEYTEIDYDATSGSRSAVRRFLNGRGSSYSEWTFADFDAQGNPETVTDPNGRETTFTYDGLGRVLSAKPPCEAGGSCTGADDTTVAFTYDVDGNLTRVQFPDDSASADVFLELGYDAAKPDQLRFIKDSQGNAIVYTYTKGRVTAEERYTGFTNLGSPGTKVGDATFSYTAAGNLFRAFNPLFGGGTVYAEFDHDAKGNPTAVEDENGKDDVLLYDALDRLTEIQQVRATTYETEFTYDALSNVTRVTDSAAKTTDLLHDDRGNLVEMVAPDTGRTRFVYDEAGNLVQKIENAPGSGTSGARITAYAYDGMNRLTEIDLPNDADWTFTYDTSASLNQRGRLAAVTNGVVETELEYTRRGDVAVERTTIDGLSYEVAYEYDAAGNRTRIEAPSGAYAVTSYAGLRPSSLAVTAGARTETITDLAWYPFGPRTMAKLPPHDGTSNTVTSSRTVNLRGQITEVDVSRTGETFLDRSYTYDYTAGAPGPNDPGPNLDRVIDAVDASENRFYFYDDLDRLEKATDLSGNVLHQYGYDAVGNRTSKVGPLGASTYRYESASNRLDAASGTEARDYAHDAYGNRIYDGASSYSSTPSLIYDDANRLVTVKDPANSFATIATYTYDAFGRRVKKVAGGETVLFFYDTDGHLIAEVTKVAGPANDASRFYVFLEDERIGIVDDVGEVGAAAPVALPRNLLHLPPPLALLALFAVAGIGVAFVTRRVSPGLATTTSGAAVLLLCAQSGGTPHVAWVHVDPLGTPLAVTSSLATYAPAEVIWRASHEPFGKAAIDEDPDGDTDDLTLNVRFPGQYEDPETGWHYNYFRDYDPNTGRYLETDPIGLQDGPNLFIYARGNPLRFIDRNGGAVDDLWGWGFPTEDEHFNRNRNNYCPKQPPKDCPGWDQDEGALGTKYRSDRGFECEYDQNGRLLPDITKWNWLGFQNYSFNYGAGRFPWTPRHVWQDFIPHFWYGDQFWFGDQPGRYPAAQTSTGDKCDCPRP